LPLVGVFRSAPIERVCDVAASLGLAAVQLHGGEDIAYVDELRPSLPEGCEIWTAVPVSDGDDPGASFGDRPLFDTQSDGGFGGTGRSFDWGRVRGREDFARSILAGGLGPDNIAAASKAGAWAL